MILASALDALLCAGLLILAAWAVTAAGEFRSSVLYTLFGLLMAVVWARLGSVDLALAEAAIGGGVTGALLLTACRAMPEPAGPGQRAGHRPGPRRALAMLVGLTAGGALGTLMWHLAAGGNPAAETAVAAVRGHFLHNPVNAVLLDFRGYDTLLEVAVLLLALIGVRALSFHAELPALQPARGADRILTAPLLRLLTPALMLAAIYLVWAGGHTSGGAFQGGVLLAALGVLYQLTGHLLANSRASAGLRGLLAAGLGLFTLFACAGLWWAGAPLAYPPGAAYGWAMAIELTLLVSIAATLAVLFAATPGIRFRGRP